MSEWTAPAGHVWVCGACGRFGAQRDRIGDESCFLNAGLYAIGRLVLSADGRRVVKMLKERSEL